MGKRKKITVMNNQPFPLKRVLLMNNRIKFYLLVTILLLVSCSKEHVKKSMQDQTVTIESHTLTIPLFFSGIVQPLKTLVVTSPVEGVIDDMPFHYGDEVKSNQLLFVISSEKFKTDYKNALMQYIKTKNEFTTAYSQLMEGQFLHKNQLISDDDFKSKKSNYYNAQLSLLQSQDALTIMLRQLAIPGLTLDQLKIENINKITQAMNLQGNSQKLRVLSPVSGFALIPAKSGGGEEIRKNEKGDQIKQGDVLAVIGDISGLSIHVNVSEFNINQLKIGQKVKVTGPAFPGITLAGKIIALDHQGQTTAGGIPNFPVEIVVPNLTPEQRAIIHIGMSAKVEVTVEQLQKITVPINAVVQKQDATFVKVKDANSGKIREVAVKTGETTMDAVVIDSGLQIGDKIIVPG